MLEILEITIWLTIHIQMIYVIFHLMILSVNNKGKAIHTMLHNVVILYVYFNDWENPIKTTLIIYRICTLSIV